MKKILLQLLMVVITIPAISQDYEIFNGCPLEGDARGEADKVTNRLKNRYLMPKAGDIDAAVTLEKMLAPGQDAGRFSENRAATITGYVVQVSKRGSSETCNCHETEPLFTDTHIEVVIDQRHGAKNQRVIVEVTPRIRKVMADQGIDWTSDALQNLEGKMVSFTGWLLWDWRHLKDSENTDPGDPQNWRATSWELHPVTAIEVLDNPLMEVGGEELETTTPVYFTSATSGSMIGSSGLDQTKIVHSPTTDPGQFLQIILLSAILGMCGQVIRVMAGLKKVKDNAVDEVGKKIKTILSDNSSSIVFSLIIALVVGGVAGILVIISTDSFVLDKSTLIALITAGYAGTDFIEGFLVKR